MAPSAGPTLRPNSHSWAIAASEYWSAAGELSSPLITSGADVRRFGWQSRARPRQCLGDTDFHKMCVLRPDEDVTRGQRAVPEAVQRRRGRARPRAAGGAGVRRQLRQGRTGQRRVERFAGEQAA